MGQYESRLQLVSLQLQFEVGKVKEMKFLDGSILDKNFYVNYTPFKTLQQCNTEEGNSTKQD